MNRQLLTTRSAAGRTSRRRGISLMEVLISMFVLAIGLMGVAALIPAGRHEIVEGFKLENAAMVGRSAFRDIQIRGYLKPNNWWDPTRLTPPVVDTTNPAAPFEGYDSSGTLNYLPTVAYCIDPLGLTGRAGSYPSEFPTGSIETATPLRPAPLRRIMPFEPASTAMSDMRSTFDTIFRSSFDLVTDPNTASKDLPPTQKYFQNGTTNLRRASEGNYSWLATVVSDPTKSALDAEVTVSVAVFYKRDLSRTGAGEYVARLNTFPVLPMTSGGEAILSQLPNDPTGKLVTVKPGQWIMLGGRKLVPGPPATFTYHYRWYRVVSAAPADTSGASAFQKVTLAGQDWSINHTNSRAWIFDNIVSVYEKNMPLEFE